MAAPPPHLTFLLSAVFPANSTLRLQIAEQYGNLRIFIAIVSVLSKSLNECS